MRYHSWLGAGLFVSLCLVGGCQRIDYQRTESLAFGEVRTLFFDAPHNTQRVTVNVDAGGVPLSAYLVLEKDEAAVKQKMQVDKTPDSSLVLDGKAGAAQMLLEGTVPAKQGFAVLFGGSSKPATVHIKVTGR